MTWLHISDLHFSPHDHGDFDRETVLDALCELVQQHRERGDWVPDLIFVTGDIANRGADKEYNAATAFFDQLLAAASLGRERLFVVPGNHDIDRPIGMFLPRTLTTEGQSDAFFADHPPPTAPSPTRTPHMGSVRPEDRHLAKLRAFRQWHETYFDGVRPTERFSACAPPTVVSLREGVSVGVLPINTATFSDDGSDHSQLWVGRAWLHRATRALSETPSDLRVALMHHPLDWLHDIERGQIKSELFDAVDVVLRGHLHDTEAEASVTPGRHVVHLAAGATWQSPSWPRRALFVRASLDERALRVRPIRFERDARRRWTLDTSVFDDHEGYEGVFQLPAKPGATATRSSSPAAAVTDLPCVARQERTWTVYPDGIAEVRVKLSGVECDDGLVLAMPERPYCAIASDDIARVPGAVKVAREHADGRTRFRLEGGGRYESCEWGYTISNALALDTFDVMHLYPHAGASPGLPSGITGRPHVVRHDSEHLRLVYEFADEGEQRHRGPIARDPQAVVEARRAAHGFERWERVRDEETRCSVAVSGDGRTVTLDVDKPVHGYRYTLAYTPAAPGHVLSSEAIEHALELLDLCRASCPGTSDLVGRLTAEVALALSDCRVGSLGDRATWLGLLWNDREKRKLMLPCFGRHTNQQWSVRFPYGGGVAGHAFRFAKVALWSRGMSPRHSVVFQEQTDAASNYTYDYRWVVCVPLLLRPRGPAIGIVSFASPDSETDGDHWLEQLVADATSNDAARTAAARTRSDTLLEMVNVRFWDCLKTSTEVTYALQHWARTVLQGFGAPPVA